MYDSGDSHRQSIDWRSSPKDLFVDTKDIGMKHAVGLVAGYRTLVPERLKGHCGLTKILRNVFPLFFLDMEGVI